MNVFYQAQCYALKRATWERTCPPASLLKTSDPRITAHLEICRHCRERLDRADGDAALSRITIKADSDDPRPGDVRRISAKWITDTYEDDGWHQPPTVLVLEADAEGWALVAQVHRYQELAAKGDVMLSGLYDAWAEPWNTWRMPVSKLNCRLAVCTPQELESVRNGIADTDAPEGIISIFHRIEKRTGDFYRRMGKRNALPEAHLCLDFSAAARSHASEEGFRLAAASKTGTSLSRLTALAGIPTQSSSALKILQHADIHYCDTNGSILRTETVPASLCLVDSGDSKLVVACIPWSQALPIAVVILGEKSEGLLVDEPALRDGELSFACAFAPEEIEKVRILRTAVFVMAE